MKPVLALAAVALLSACATRPAERMAVMVTANGDDLDIPDALSTEVRRRLSASPYLRPGGFSDSLRIGIDAGVELAGGKTYAFDVEYVLAGSMSGRKIHHDHTHLGWRKIRCPTSDLQRCADRIIAGAVASLPKARKIIAKAPPVTDDAVDLPAD